jgi:putative membrane protein
MKRAIILAACCLAFATPALSQSLGEKTGVNSTLGVAPTTADFVREVAISDMFELQSNKLGEQKGTAAQKSFASMMIADHTKTSNELKAMVTGGKVKAQLPTALDSAHQSKLDKLGGMNGNDFASNFTTMQIDAHEDAVNLFERYSKGGDDPALKDWAGKTLPALQHHLEMARNLKK